MKPKAIAATAMAIDHAGLIASSTPLRIIGRISFPLFAWQFSQTWKLTSNKEKLSSRLLLWGAISQIPYTLMTGSNRINAILGFWAIAEILKIINKSKPKYKLLALILGAIGCEMVKVDYGWYGPIAVVMMTCLTQHPVWWFSWSLVNLAYSLQTSSVIQIWAIAAPILINPKSEEKTPSAIEKKFYYYFYPLHMSILAILKGVL